MCEWRERRVIVANGELNLKDAGSWLNKRFLVHVDTAHASHAAHTTHAVDSIDAIDAS